uniref:Sushi domain-containing protein n=1 Tax=Steinernema glaseri TaxID=37863 RepID=A0A1I7Y572_9BILA
MFDMVLQGLDHFTSPIINLLETTDLTAHNVCFRSVTLILSVFLLLCLLQWVDSCAPQFDTESLEKGSKGKSDPSKKTCSQESLSRDDVTASFAEDTTTAYLTCQAKTKEIAFFLVSRSHFFTTSTCVQFNNDADRKLAKSFSTEAVLKCVDGKWKSSELDAPITKVTCGEDVERAGDGNGNEPTEAPKTETFRDCVPALELSWEGNGFPKPATFDSIRVPHGIPYILTCVENNISGLIGALVNGKEAQPGSEEVEVICNNGRFEFGGNRVTSIGCL